MTITVDEQLARWARIEAAKNDISLSRYVSNMLRNRMQHAEAYGAAMQHNLRRAPTVLSSKEAYPARESLHER